MSLSTETCPVCGKRVQLGFNLDDGTMFYRRHPNKAPVYCPGSRTVAKTRIIGGRFVYPGPAGAR